MRKYVTRRLLLFIPTFLLVSVLVFCLMRLVPGDVALLILAGAGEEGTTIDPKQLAGLREQLGLNAPLIEQYFSWLWNFVTLDWGNSLRDGEDIRVMVAKRLPLTAELALLSILISLVSAIPLGVLAAVKQDTWVDNVVRLVTVGGMALPTFFTGTLLILGLVTFLEWIPPLGKTGLYVKPWEAIKLLIWPALVLGFFFSAVIARMTRATMLEVLRQDYMRTARAKGIWGVTIVFRHGLKNALLPVVTLSGIQFGHLLGGTVIMEAIFVLPGIGTSFIQALNFRDYPAIQTIIVLIALMFMVINLIVDLGYGWLDPRIRYE